MRASVLAAVLCRFLRTAPTPKAAEHCRTPKPRDNSDGSGAGGPLLAGTSGSGGRNKPAPRWPIGAPEGQRDSSPARPPRPWATIISSRWGIGWARSARNDRRQPQFVSHWELTVTTFVALCRCCTSTRTIGPSFNVNGSLCCRAKSHHRSRNEQRENDVQYLQLPVSGA